MKTLIYLLIISGLFFSCGAAEEKSTDSAPEKKEEPESNDTVATIIKPDTLYLIPDYENPVPKEVSGEDFTLLKEFFTDSLIAELFALNTGFDSIQTEKQLFLYYSALTRFKQKASVHLMSLNASEEFGKKVLAAKDEDGLLDEYRYILDYILTKLKPIDKYLKGLTLTCVAECSEPSYDLVLNNLIGLAKKTEGESDEKFIQLIIDTFTGEYDPDILNANWFEQTWDYGGMSLLGSNKHFDFLFLTDKLLEENNLFKDAINAYRNECFHDITQWRTFAYDKETILKEVNKILKEIRLTDEQLNALKARKKELEDFKGNDPEKRGLQLGCKTGKCSFG